MDFKELFELTQDIICTTEFDGTIRSVNPSGIEALGYTSQELMKKPFIDLIHPQDQENTKSQFAKLNNGSESIQFENRYICKDGSLKFFSWF